MTEKNLSLLEKEEINKKKVKIKTLNDFLDSNKKYEDLDFSKKVEKRKNSTLGATCNPRGREGYRKRF